MKAILSTKEKYTTVAIPALKKLVGTENLLAIPRLERIVVHSGLGRFTKESAAVKELEDAVIAIAGQKPVFTKAKKSIAGFKIREGQNIGVMVTLRGERMWTFFDRLIAVALPRVRDFQGIKLSSVDACGNLNIGIKEHTVFPEIIAEKASRSFGLQITVKTNAKTHEEGIALFRALGVPFVKQD